jgi:methionyl-tRNA formyltransferase
MKWALAGCKQQAQLIYKQACIAGIPPACVFTLPEQPAEDLETYSSVTISDDLSEHIEQLRKMDLLLTCRFNLLKGSIFNAPRLGSVNVHSALLPAYRGVHPVAWAMVNGDDHTGVTLHTINAGIDTGDLLQQAAVKIHDDESGWQLVDKLDQLSAAMAVSLLTYIKQTGELPSSQPQPVGNYFYARRRTVADNQINWQQPARLIKRLIALLQPPYPSAFSIYQERKIFFTQATILNQTLSASPGTILKQDNEGYLIQAQDGQVFVTTDAQLSVGERLI